jgi:hypothetical protein
MSSIITVGGLCFVVGALAFVGVFTWLAAKFDYPGVLDGDAATVLPGLRKGGPTMRAVWAIYAFLPLLLVPGAIGAFFALRRHPGEMTLAVILASIGTLSMCLGLMRWPSIHWHLAEAYERATDEAKQSIAATFRGLNLYLGNYIGEFLGELCLGGFFLLSGHALLGDARFPGWASFCGMGFGLLFFVGAFRNVTRRVQWVANFNNMLLPIWMFVFGGLLIARAT